MKKIMIVGALILMAACQKDYYLEDLQDAEREVTQLRTQLNTAQSSLNNLQSQITQFTIENSRLQSTLEGIHNDYADEISDLRLRLTLEQANNATLSREIEDLEDAIGDLSESLSVYIEDENYVSDVRDLFTHRFRQGRFSRFSIINIEGLRFILSQYGETGYGNGELGGYFSLESEEIENSGVVISISAYFKTNRHRNTGEPGNVYIGPRKNNCGWGGTNLYYDLYDTPTQFEMAVLEDIIEFRDSAIAGEYNDICN